MGCITWSTAWKSFPSDKTRVRLILKFWCCESEENGFLSVNRMCKHAHTHTHAEQWARWGPILHLNQADFWNVSLRLKRNLWLKTTGLSLGSIKKSLYHCGSYLHAITKKTIYIHSSLFHPPSEHKARAAYLSLPLHSKRTIYIYDKMCVECSRGVHMKGGLFSLPQSLLLQGRNLAIHIYMNAFV